MSKTFFVVIISYAFAFISHNTFAQDKPEWELKTYQMVFLYKGENRNQDSVEAAKTQAGHLANIQRLSDEGKLIVAGPFLDDQDLRGIFIFDVATEEEVKELVETDLAIKTGRLKYEIRTWMTNKGTCFK